MILLLNLHLKETLSKVFYYRTGKFIDEISEDELAEFGERKITSYEHICTNIPDEFKIAFNEIISSFNDKSQYKVPLLK